MVVALATRATEDIGDGVEASGALMSLLHGRSDFALRRTTVDMDTGLGGLGARLVLGAVGDEGPLDFIGMQKSGLLTVGLAQFILVGVGFGAEKICPFGKWSVAGDFGGGRGIRLLRGNVP